MKKLGFSLMEMMVVLLIVAVVAAVSAPMINKKLLSEVELNSSSPWVWGAGSAFTWFNPDGIAKPAIIGRSAVLNGFSNSKLFIESGIKNNDDTYTATNSPQLVLSNAASQMKILYKNDEGFSLIAAADIPQNMDLASNSVAIGTNLTAHDSVTIGVGANTLADRAAGEDTGAVAIGRTANAGASSVSVGEGANSRNRSVAIGEQATARPNGSNPSVAIGYKARVADKGKTAVAIGDTAQASNTGSIAIGGNDGGTLTKATGDRSIAIGIGAQATGSHSVAIGAGVVSSTDNEIQLGRNPNDTSRSIGPDTVFIPGNLVVAGNVLLGAHNGTYTYLRHTNDHGNKIMRIISSDMYHTDRALYSAGLNTTDSAYSTFSTYIDYYGTALLSDRRLKNVGEAFKGGLAEVRKLDVFNFTYKKDPNKTPMVGVMAQDLQKIFPNAVVKGDDGFLRIRMEDMFYALVNAVKELDRNITSISKEVKTAVADIASLKAKIDSQAKEISELRAQNNELVKKNAEFEKRLCALEKKH